MVGVDGAEIKSEARAWEWELWGHVRGESRGWRVGFGLEAEWEWGVGL